jgi:uncharacterized protein (TIGR00299 family) protein
MKKILLLDCSSGISGDMFLGSLIDCGLDIRRLSLKLKKMKIGRYGLKARKVKRAGMAGVKFDVIYGGHSHEHSDKKTYKGIVSAIRSSGLSGRVKKDSISVFTNLAKAESRAHGVPLDKVHFHEVGDIDSVVDIVGACVALEELEIDEVRHTCLTVARPAPATAHLLRGSDIKIDRVPFELVTPTGAAILKTFSRPMDGVPHAKVLETGCGAGSAQIPGKPNLLRSMIIEVSAPDGGRADSVTVIETNIDDLNPQAYEYLIERLLASGALDAYITPVLMKKSRPACVLTVVAVPSDAAALADVIFEETPTFGIRMYSAERSKLERKVVEVKTKYGNIKVKLGFFKGELNTYSPEYEDCKKAARLKGVPFETVRREATRAITGEKQRLV